jgi:putative acyl-CoA dehydrogenase
VLADLALETEAAAALVIRLAGATDRADGEGPDGHEARLRRVGTAVGKYWVCKRTASHAVEALECLGGNGYVEESMMPRLYREAPLNSIWEGSGNVNCLDVLRALYRDPETAEAILDEVGLAGGADARLDAAAARLRNELADASDLEHRARRLVELMALALQGSLLVRHAPPAVADAFCASRLGGDWGQTFGTLPPGVDTAAIIERATPRPVA